MKQEPVASLTLSWCLTLLAAFVLGACPGKGVSAGDAGGLTDAGAAGDGGPGLDGGPGDAGSGDAGPLTCPDGGTTSVSGTIYDPAGLNPLYGAVAYIPSGTVLALSKGASCAPCSAFYSGQPVAAAVTDANGQFTLTGAPAGTAIPLVIQVGKWRRQFTLPNVARCANTAVPEGTLTLPKNGGEGDMPDIAVSTGGADTLECVLRRIGIDANEYVPGSSDAGHIHIFQGAGGFTTNPPAPASNKGLWDSAADLGQFDLVMLSCEGSETTNMNQQALFDYAADGGRVLASHFHYAWFNSGPFGSAGLASWVSGSNDIGNVLADPVTSWNGQSFTRGQALHDWLVGRGATNDAGQLLVLTARHNADVTVANPASQPWLFVTGTGSQAQHFTFDTPLNSVAGQACGRVGFTEFHASPTAIDYSSSSITPDGCDAGALTADEKAVEYFLFDLSSCVTANNAPFTPPAVQH